MQRLSLVVTFVTVLGACGSAQRTSPSTEIEFIYVDEGDDDDSADPCLEAQVWPGDHDCLGRVPYGRQEAP